MSGRPIALLIVAMALARCAAPPPAAALDPVKPICALAGLVSTLAGKLCSTAAHPRRLLSTGKQLFGGHLGRVVQTLAGDGAGTVAKSTAAAAGIAAVGAWVAGGAKFALRATASVIATSTGPELQSTWFSSAYWRMAAISALLTLPFLFAAAIQAIMHSDLALLARAALGYLPLAMLAVGVAAPLTTLLLAASDELSGIVSSASGDASGAFLAHAGFVVAGLTAASRSPFLAFFVGLITAAATLTLWIELLIRSAAVYVIVLLLPLFFAALVWPARRVWAVRAVELLVALILSKFAIVAVLALGGAALTHGGITSITSMLAGATLVLLAAFSPWALLRMLPLHELAGGAAGGLRSEARHLASSADRGINTSDAAQEIAQLRRQEAQETSAAQAALEGLAPARGATRTQSGSDARDRGDAATNGVPEPRHADSAGPGSAPAPPDDSAASASSSAVPQTRSAPSLARSEAIAGDDPGATPAAPDPAAEAAAPQERSPGMHDVYQAPDMSLRPLSLGPEHGWPPPPDEDSDLAAADTSGTASDAAEGKPSGEDHDPRPPRQEPDGGRL